MARIFEAQSSRLDSSMLIKHERSEAIDSLLKGSFFPSSADAVFVHEFQQFQEDFRTMPRTSWSAHEIARYMVKRNQMQTGIMDATLLPPDLTVIIS